MADYLLCFADEAAAVAALPQLRVTIHGVERWDPLLTNTRPIVRYAGGGVHSGFALWAWSREPDEALAALATGPETVVSAFPVWMGRVYEVAEAGG